MVNARKGHHGAGCNYYAVSDRSASRAHYLSLSIFCISAHWLQISQWLLFLTFLKFISLCHLSNKNYFIPLLNYSLKTYGLYVVLSAKFH